MVIVTKVEGVLMHLRRRLRSETGTFIELHSNDAQFKAAQVSMSTIDSGNVRGIHFTVSPPGQHKTVTCIDGEVLDFTIDLRHNSPTFLKSQAIFLSSKDAQVPTLHLAPWVGHAIYAVQDSTLIYTHSIGYNPATERTLLISDPELNIDWMSYGIGHLHVPMSNRDKLGRSLGEMIQCGDLPCMTLESTA